MSISEYRDSFVHFESSFEPLAMQDSIVARFFKKPRELHENAVYLLQERSLSLCIKLFQNFIFNSMRKALPFANSARIHDNDIRNNTLILHMYVFLWLRSQVLLIQNTEIFIGLLLLIK